eukprot:1192786-Prorocentrum_minimum.AAC.3
MALELKALETDPVASRGISSYCGKRQLSVAWRSTTCCPGSVSAVHSASRHPRSRREPSDKTTTTASLALRACSATSMKSALPSSVEHSSTLSNSGYVARRKSCTPLATRCPSLPQATTTISGRGLVVMLVCSADSWLSACRCLESSRLSTL